MSAERDVGGVTPPRPILRAGESPPVALPDADEDERYVGQGDLDTWWADVCGKRGAY